MNTEYQNESFLREQYVNNRLSQAEIAEKCGTTQPEVSHYIQKFNIVKPARKPHHNDNWLREKYVTERLSMSEIAERCGVSVSAISDKIRRSSIESEGINGDRNPMSAPEKRTQSPS